MKKSAKPKRLAPVKRKTAPTKNCPVTMVGSDSRLPVPDEIVRDAGAKTGDKFAAWIEGGEIIVIFPKSYRGQKKIPKNAYWGKVEPALTEIPIKLTKPAKPVWNPIPETLTEGWRFGSYTCYADPKGCCDGDGFVIAPDGQRAELDWVIGTGNLKRTGRSDKRVWGVFEIGFPRPVTSRADLVENFRAVLPQIKAAFARHQKRQRAK